MENVKVEKQKLIDVMKKNRSLHRECFLKAQEGFRKAIIKALDKRLKLARKGKRVNMIINLPEPTDQTADYDRVIRMLSMSVDKVIELSEQEFSCYVQDNWQWKRQFISASSNYMNTAKYT